MRKFNFTASSRVNPCTDWMVKHTAATNNKEARFVRAILPEMERKARCDVIKS